MNQTPSAERLHITVFGKRNTGKSSLINAITRQETSLVSDMPGTTTDPVRKAMEIPGLGPCIFTDTAGFDDDAEGIGAGRVWLAAKAMDGTDIAIMIFRDCDPEEKEWYGRLSGKGIPVIPVINTGGPHGAHPQNDLARTARYTESLCREKPVTVNPLTGEGIENLFSAVLHRLPDATSHRSITGGLVREGDTVMLVMPQDSQAPKGRLILPQVQTIRELLDRKCTVVCCTAGDAEKTIGRLSVRPDLIITDSQAFPEAMAAKPEGCRITSFSVLFAAYKGDIRTFTQGARAMERLNDSSRVLIAEACTHAPAAEDIGRVKIPGMLRRRFGQGMRIDTASGNDFPQDLSAYDLIIHCGACMFNRRYVLDRIASARRQGIPITNYGIAIAWLTGILDSITLPEPCPGEGPE